MLRYMTKLLQEAMARIEMLPEEEQDRVAEALNALATESRRYSLTVEQLDGIRHAMEQADRGEFATVREVDKIFGRAV